MQGLLVLFSESLELSEVGAELGYCVLHSLHLSFKLDNFTLGIAWLSCSNWWHNNRLNRLHYNRLDLWFVLKFYIWEALFRACLDSFFLSNLNNGESWRLLLNHNWLLGSNAFCYGGFINSVRSPTAVAGTRVLCWVGVKCLANRSWANVLFQVEGISTFEIVPENIEGSDCF